MIQIAYCFILATRKIVILWICIIYANKEYPDKAAPTELSARAIDASMRHQS